MCPGKLGNLWTIQEYSISKKGPLLDPPVPEIIELAYNSKVSKIT